MTFQTVEPVFDRNLIPKSQECECESKTADPPTINRENIINTISVILTDIIREQEAKLSSESPIPQKTLFHAKKVPGIAIRDYLKRIGEFSKCSDECFVHALIYIDLIAERNPSFVLDILNVHRVLLLSIISAAKFYDDKFYENKYYASIGGVSLEEFVLLEKEFLFSYIDFKLYVPTETYELYHADISTYYLEKIYQAKENSNSN